MHKIDPEVFLDWCMQIGRPPIFKGHEPLGVLWQRGRIIANHTIIKVICAGMPDKDYQVNESGLLIILGKENVSPLELEEVLAEERNPDGWRLYKFLRHRAI